MNSTATPPPNESFAAGNEVQPSFTARPEDLFGLGYTDLVSVIPPGAQLAPTSKIVPPEVGKVPGQRRADGLWVGYNWRKHQPTPADVRQWSVDGASVGLRADRFPGVDIDVLDEPLAKIIEDVALQTLGPAPVRVGRPPKRLVMYRTDGPFTRLRLRIEKGDTRHLVEILGQGQQYVVSGIHPVTLKHYEWNKGLDEASTLTAITCEQAGAFLDKLTSMLESAGWKCTRGGDGKPQARAAADQTALKASSLNRLREAVRLIPNDNERFPDRDGYIKMGYAIHAAGADDPDEAFGIYAEWAAKWEGNGRVPGNDPEIVRADWRRMHGPYSVGWSWIAERARPFGFNDAADDFEAVAANPGDHDTLPPDLTEFNSRYAMVHRVAKGVLYTPAKGLPHFMPYRHWQLMNDNKHVERKPRPITIHKAWMEHPRRRDYDNVTFDPARSPLTGIPSELDDKLQDFNLWPGLAMEASAEGSCELLTEHLRVVVCRGDHAAYAWVIQWFAAMVQQPDRLPGTALVLRGVQGAGKSIVGEIMAKILGPSLCVLLSKPGELTGNFNVHLAGKILVMPEESFFAGDKSVVGTLKTLITAPTILIEPKGVDRYSLRNVGHQFITSNEGWVVPAEEGERRFCVFDVDPKHAKDRKYFGAIHRQMFEEGGCARFLHHLLHEVVVDWDLIASPFATPALRDQQMLTMSYEKQWLLGVLNDGKLPGDERGEGIAPKEKVYNHYVESVPGRGYARPIPRERFGKFLIAFGAASRKVHILQVPTPIYDFPPLAVCRQAYAKSLATPPDWDDVASWQTDDPFCPVTDGQSGGNGAGPP